MVDFIFDKEAVRQKLKPRGAISASELASAVGLSHRSVVGKILSGERQVKVDEAAKIYDYLRLVPVEHEAVRNIPIIGMASAGRWREAIEMPIGRMMLPAHVAGARAFAVEVRGDSMDKLIPDGGWIAIDPDDKVLRDGKSYLLQNDDHEATVKQYRTNPNRFEPMSENPEHKCFLANEYDIKIMGRVVWKGSPL